MRSQPRLARAFSVQLPVQRKSFEKAQVVGIQF